jgi:thiamine-phosphate pyrophosphorylase
MKLAVISPPGDDAREIAALDGMVDAGLMRYHVRKPGMSRAALAAWLRALSPEWLPRLVLHQHHELVDEFGLGGRHWSDDGSAPARPLADAGTVSRSCHDLPGLHGALGFYDAVLFGPVFPSLSKPGYGPAGASSLAAAAALFARRSAVERFTAVFALGGVTAPRLSPLAGLGFDGAAVLGAVWQAADPVAAFRGLQAALPAGAAMQ